MPQIHQLTGIYYELLIKHLNAFEIWTSLLVPPAQTKPYRPKLCSHTPLILQDF